MKKILVLGFVLLTLMCLKSSVASELSSQDIDLHFDELYRRTVEKTGSPANSGAQKPEPPNASAGKGEEHETAEEILLAEMSAEAEALGPEHPDAAAAWENIGVVCRILLKDYAKAREYGERALAIRLKLFGEEHADTASLLYSLGVDYSELGDYAKAKEYDERALAVRLKLFGDEDHDTASSLNNLGNDCHKLGDYAKAKEYHERALAIWLKLFGDEDHDTASSLNNLGVDYDKLGDYAKAEEYIKRALAIRLKLFGEKDPDTAWSLNNLGSNYLGLGDYVKAKEYIERALAIRLKLFGENHADTANSLNNLGAAHCRLGSHLKEKEYYERAVAIYRKVLGDDHPVTLSVLNNLGNAYYHFNDYGKAKEYHEEIRSFRHKAGKKDDEDNARTFSSLAVDHRGLGDYAKAKEYDERALAIRLKILGEEHPDAAKSLANLGYDYYKLGDYAKAEEFYERALAVNLKILGGEHPDTAYSFYLLGEFYNSMRQKDAAILYKKMAVNITQKVRTSLTVLDEDLQKSFLQSKEFAYLSLADLLVEEGRIPEAQQVLSMLKEEEFFDYIQRDEKTDPRITTAEYTNLEQKQADRFHEISSQLFAYYQEQAELLKKKGEIPDAKWNSSADGKRLAKVDNALSALTNDLFVFLDRLETELKTGTGREPKLAATSSGYLEYLQKNLKETGDGTVLIHTLVTPEHVWLILTTADGQVHINSPISQKELFAKILDFRESLENPGGKDPRPVAKELYDILIAPISGDLIRNNAQTLMFSLHGPLRYVPMAALHDGTGWLAEKYAVTVFTDAIKEKLANKRNAKIWEAAALGVSEPLRGFSQLPAVSAELEFIVKRKDKKDKDGVISGTIRLNREFTESAFIAALKGGASFVHVATHFSLKPGTAADSFLLLGDGGELTLKRVRDRAFNFEKVDQLTLSACNTGIDFGEGAGREMEGLGVLAQMQGAKSVMATLWSINDASTGVFMPHFYELLQQEGMTKAEALRQTQAEFIDGRIEETEAYAAVIRGEKATKKNIGGTRGESPQYRGYSHPYFWAPFILMGNWQ
ncbi:MAG: tetratricopeptide repeat protein [Synergistaceae bacterium]|nr:tetratricopeptide repeat protein [Synergistaceae bacterium]